MGQVQGKKDSMFDNTIRTFRILWLDAQVNANDNNRAVQQHLRKLDKNLSTFENLEECYKYIVSMLSDDRIVFIVSGQLGKKIVPQIHQIPQIRSIYIYCENMTLHKQWATSFNKVKIVADKLAEIIERIQSDRDAITIAEATSSKSTKYCTVIDDPIDNPIAFLEYFIRIKSSQADIAECISFCRNKYRDDQHELELIQEFQQTYASERAIWWYTRQSFVYRILSKILREENIRLIYLFRFLIVDIYQQLKQCQCQSVIRVFRGQLLPDKDVIYFKTLVGKTITVKSFFTTCLSRDRARSGLKSSTSEFKQVLFEINATPRSTNRKPFGDISLYSAFPQEGEVLFMAASNFHIDDVHYGEDHMWIIRMTLASAESQNSKEFLQRIDMMEKCVGGLNLISFSTIMRHMGHVNRAKNYCYRLFKELSSENSLSATVCFELAEIASIEGDPKANKRWYEKALDFTKKYNVGNGSNHEPAPKSASIPSRCVDNNLVPALQNSATQLTITNHGMMTSQRFTSLALDKHQVQLPIEGYEKMPLVPLEEAVLPLLDVLPDIHEMVRIVKTKCALPANGLTSDQSAAIMLYTMEWEPSQKCLYFVLNSALRTANRQLIQPWFLYLKLVLTALSRLPSKPGTVYRGVKLDLSSQHFIGEKFYWWSFSSCTTTMNILKSDQFLGGTGIRTLFAIESRSGKDISQHSYYQEEEEILLLPATQFQVIACLPFGQEVHIIQLKEIKSEFPLLESIM
ncbi:unnamed protein product [Rotaria sp. Silwood1]|nr:unnamed protein product [Rotaria sp. Silwood1]CAF0907824.1 unnamed protein product [Rotaria sp. Silwood1]CAF3375134.1 unnamed protein product [Rotaria sp. Silwood1]